MYEEDVALNNLQWLICHKTKPNHLQTPVFAPITINFINVTLLIKRSTHNFGELFYFLIE